MGEDFLKQDLLKTAELMPGVRGTHIERPKMYSYEGGETKTFKFTLANTNHVDDIAKNWQLIFMLLYQQLPNKISKVLLEPPVIYEVEIPGVFYTPFAYIQTVNVANKGAIRKMKVPVLYYKGIREKLNLGAMDASRTGPDWNAKIKGTKPRKTVNRVRPSASNSSTKPKGPGEVTGRVQQGTSTAAQDPVEEWVETIVPDAWEITITINSLIPPTKNLLFHSTLGPGTKNTGLYNITLKDDDARTIGQDNMMGASEAVRRAVKQNP